MQPVDIYPVLYGYTVPNLPYYRLANHQTFCAEARLLLLYRLTSQRPLMLAECIYSLDRMHQRWPFNLQCLPLSRLSPVS